MTSHVTVRWYVDDQEVPDTSQSGRLNVVGDNFPVLKPMGRLKHPRADGSFVLSKLTSEPHLEDCTVTISHGNFHGRITFETREEAMAFLQTALKKVAKQTPPAVPAAVVPVPKKTGTQKRRHIDEAFTEMSLHGRSELLGVQHKVEEVSSKRRAIDSRTTSSPEQTSKRIARIPIRAPAPSSSILQRRPSKTPQDSSLYGGYRPAISFGLQNLGNTCYLNAITQALGSLREFVEDLRAMPKHLPDVSNGALFRCTVEILQKMQDSALYAPLSPAKLREQIALAAPMFQGNVQQDAHEFFLEYMNQLHDEMLKLHQGWVAKNSHAAIEEPALATQTHFDAEVQRQLSCVQCGQARTVTERFRDFSLDFSGEAIAPERLQAMLQRYFQPETLEAKCEHCSAVEANLDTNLTDAPRVMVLHLKRFVPNIEKQCYEKQHQAVEIPTMLDLGATLSSSSEDASPPRLPARPLAAPSVEAPGSPQKVASSLRYSLRAIVAHEGASPRSGHYVCYAQASSGEWRLYDDSRVKRFAPGEEPQKDLGRKAYMLFYVLNSPDGKSPPTSAVGA